MTREAVAAAYGRLVEQYVEVFGAVEQVRALDLAVITRVLGDLRGPVLDLGCGPGHLTAHLHARGVDVTGLDITPEFLAHARAAHPGVPYALGSLLELDQPDGSVAGALAHYSLIHLEPSQLDVALAGLRRVLAPGAPLVVGVFTWHELGPYAHRVVTDWRWPLPELSARLARAGFEVVERHERAVEGERPQALLVAR